MSFFVLFNPIPVESAEVEELFMKISCLYTLKVKDYSNNSPKFLMIKIPYLKNSL